MCCIAKGKNLCYNLIRKRAWHQVNKWCIWPWLRNYKASAKAILRLSGIFFTASTHVETIVLLSKLKSSKHIEVELKMDELDLTAAERKATYQEIKDYILKKHDIKVSSLYIAQIKEKYGIISKSEDVKQPKCPPEKEKLIEEALRYFKMIS